MNITVLGAGVVGTNLAVAAQRLGHPIRFGARDTACAKVVAALAAVPEATAVPLAEATADADLVVLAVPFAAVAHTLAAVGDLSGTVLVDATNTVGGTLPEGDRTIVDGIRRARPEATVVKAFNTIGAEAYLDPVIDGLRTFLPVAGDPDGAAAVAALAMEMGFDALVIGGYDQVEQLEDFARLWIHLAFGVGLGRDFGFVRAMR